ncbi:MAG: hypothetical protein ABS949_08350 [Solibacillus sp.]
MARRIANPSTQICAMCPHWNEAVGGLFVNPRTNQRNFFDFDNEEKQTCYKNHFVKQAWNSCSEWEKRY